MREQGQTCLDWCKYAKECLGKELYKKYLKNKGGKDVNKKGKR